MMPEFDVYKQSTKSICQNLSWILADTFWN